MMEDFKNQAERFGADIRFGIATSVDFSTNKHRVTFDDNKTVEADSVIIATGATAKYLGLESETKYAGMGVSACATCDGFFFKGKDVAVVGGEEIQQLKRQPTWPVYAVKYTLLSEEMS